MSISRVPRCHWAAAAPCVLAAALGFSCSGSTDGSGVSPADAQRAADGSDQGPDLDGELGNGGADGRGSGSMNGVVPITRDAACVIDSAAADAIPAVVQLVVDTSGSMQWPPGWMPSRQDDRPPRGDTKWEITRVALRAAVADLPATVALGLSFYPNDPGRNSCIRNRIELPIALLGADDSDQRRGFNQAIDDAQTEGGTPTHAAYRFGAESVASSNLAGQKFVLLITDGTPTYTLTCQGDGNDPVDSAPLIAEAKSVFEDGISTFVIGSPGSEGARQDLSRMATEGGTASAGCSDAGPAYCHLDMTEAPDFGTALAAGLGQIAGRISACEYAVPSPPSGQTLDPTLVNVIFIKGDGSEHSIPHDPSKTECNSGWQDSDDFTKITLCGADCDAVKADPEAQIELLFGCMTQVGEPPR